MTRRGDDFTNCPNVCATYIANLEASPNGGSGSPSSIPSYYFLCTDSGDFSHAITISLDGNALDPAITFASYNGQINSSMCYSMSICLVIATENNVYI